MAEICGVLSSCSWNCSSTFHWDEYNKKFLFHIVFWLLGWVYCLWAILFSRSSAMVRRIPLPLGRETYGLLDLPMTNTLLRRVAKVWSAKGTMKINCQCALTCQNFSYREICTEETFVARSLGQGNLLYQVICYIRCLYIYTENQKKLVNLERRSLKSTA